MRRPPPESTYAYCLRPRRRAGVRPRRAAQDRPPRPARRARRGRSTRSRRRVEEEGDAERDGDDADPVEPAPADDRLEIAPLRHARRVGRLRRRPHVPAPIAPTRPRTSSRLRFRTGRSRRVRLVLITRRLRVVRCRPPAFGGGISPSSVARPCGALVGAAGACSLRSSFRRS